MAWRQCNNKGAELMMMNVDTKNLPLDVLVHILARLPVESLCCIRCVSKAMLDMVDGHSFVTLHTRLLLTSGQDHVPQLMYITRFYNPPKLETRGSYLELAALQSLKYDGDTTLTKGKHALTLFTSQWYDLQTYKVDFVFYNLFCYRNLEEANHGHCFLLDPLHGEILRLPPCDIQDTSIVYLDDIYGMGFDSLTGTYKIVRVSRKGRPDNRGRVAEDFMVTHVFVLGTSSWRDISSVPPYALSSIKSVSACGDMHWMSIDIDKRTCHIVSFDFKKEEFCSSPLPKLHECGHSHLFSVLHLVTLRGSLATVDACLSTDVTMNVEIWVLKDYDKKLWTRDYTISVEMDGPRFNFKTNNIICGEWEHGIFFKHIKGNHNNFFLDMKRHSIKVVPFGTGNISRICGYTKSLISLKDYDSSGRLETSTASLKRYGKLVKGGVEDFSLSKCHIMRRISSSRI